MRQRVNWIAWNLSANRAASRSALRILSAAVRVSLANSYGVYHKTGWLYNTGDTFRPRVSEEDISTIKFTGKINVKKVSVSLGVKFLSGKISSRTPTRICDYRGVYLQSSSLILYYYTQVYWLHTYNQISVYRMQYLQLIFYLQARKVANTAQYYHNRIHKVLTTPLPMTYHEFTIVWRSTISNKNCAWRIPRRTCTHAPRYNEPRISFHLYALACRVSFFLQ